jgi:signal transduction histidine kinase/Tfp pilus assembly protein PilF
MKFLPLIVFILFLPFILSAQTDISQLVASCEHTTGIEDKIGVYSKIIIYYSDKNPDSVNWYAEKALDLSSSQNYDLGTAKILNQLSVIDEKQGRVELSRERALKALGIFRKLKDLKGAAETIHNLGTVEASKGNYNIAIKYFIDALKVYDSVKDNHGLLLNYMNLGNIYVQTNDTANAWKYFGMAETISKNTQFSDATVFLHNIIGVMYDGEGKKDTALQIFRQALKESDKPEFFSSHAECLLYLGEYYQENNQTDSAFLYLEQGLKTSIKNNLPEMQSNFLMEIARILEKSDPDSAMNYLERAKKLAETLHSKVFLSGIYDEIASLLERQGKFKEALYAMREKQKLTDSVFSIEKTRDIANISSSWQLETNQQIKELEVLIKHNARQRHELELIASILIIFLLAIFFYWGKSKKLNKQLAIQHKQLEEINSMKDKLFSVIGHDLRGPIARIPAMIEIIEDEATTEEDRKFLFDNLKEQTKVSLETFDKLLYWGRLLVKGISLQQQKFKPNTYIKESIELRKIKAAEKNITVIDNTPPELTIFSDPSIFDFIMRNFLANALKYTPRNGNIEITTDTKSKPGFTVFGVKDTGMGIDPELLPKLFYLLKSRDGTDNEKGNGIGLMLCKEFAIQNGGDIWVESEKGKGATFYLSVKS